MFRLVWGHRAKLASGVTHLHFSAIHTVVFVFAELLSDWLSASACNPHVIDVLPGGCRAFYYKSGRLECLLAWLDSD